MALDPTNDFDHGTFTRLAVMFPEADVPEVQVSLKLGYDPAEYWALGRALAPLRDEGVLILGSGCVNSVPARRAPRGRSMRGCSIRWSMRPWAAERHC